MYPVHMFTCEASTHHACQRRRTTLRSLHAAWLQSMEEGVYSPYRVYMHQVLAQKCGTQVRTCDQRSCHNCCPFSCSLAPTIHGFYNISQFFHWCHPRPHARHSPIHTLTPLNPSLGPSRPVYGPFVSLTGGSGCSAGCPAVPPACGGTPAVQGAGAPL